jgi:hypothetical protein
MHNAFGTFLNPLNHFFMQHHSNTDQARQINNLVARIKSRYPHLYEETGGKYIRKILRKTLEVNNEAGATPAEQALPERNTRVVKHRQFHKTAA